MRKTTTITLIPAIDLIDGRCVRLAQGDYGRRSTYEGDPVEVARRYEDAGVGRLHLVDLDGAKASAPRNLQVLERIAAATSLDIEFGGGIKSAESLAAVFAAGARRAICGSVAVTDPRAVHGWIAEFGPGKIILGADVRDGVVATHGWLAGSAYTAVELIDEFVPSGLSQVICTDISKDGMLQGPSFGLYEELQRRWPDVEITVSGGIGSMDDIRRLDSMGLRSVIVGRALYEGKITINDIKLWIARE